MKIYLISIVIKHCKQIISGYNSDMLLGVDTGGTFTDFVHFSTSGLRFHKVLSTPDDPSLAIEQGIRELKLEASALHLVHGSTVATNAILERKGVRTLFVTHRGLEDLLTIGRQTRPELYELCPQPPSPLVERKDCFGISGRIDAAGDVQQAINPADLHHLAEVAGDYDAVAVCLLFSFLNPEHERQVSQALSDKLFTSLSNETLAEFREFERGATTFLNAYIGPLVQSYLKRLELSLNPKHMFVMHSAGGVMSAEMAGLQAVKLVLSGPAGGLVAAKEVGRQLDESNLMTFDMGGTSTDVALICGEAGITTEGQIGGIPVAVPMLDIHTIGAGGGSLAWLDEAGLPQVGPESAGAKPGPVCYGLGGAQVTVTDANLLLGRIPSSAQLAGTMSLDLQMAQDAFSRFAEELGLSAQIAAEAVIEIAEEHMAGALRVVSVQRGFDPADFVLLSFGGAGGLHACSLAEKLSMSRVTVPLASGAFSALGMLAGRQQTELSVSRRMQLNDDSTMLELSSIFSQLEDKAEVQMKGLSLSFERRVDMSYAGQGFQLSVSVEDNDLDALSQRFEAAHQQAYGHTLERPVEIVTARITAFVERPALDFPELSVDEYAAQAEAVSEVYGAGSVSHYRRADLRPGHKWQGPALVLEDTATLWLPINWSMTVSKYGHLLLEKSDVC
jgi:N-methylhydantoinase A